MSTATDYKHRAHLPINTDRDDRRMRRRRIALVVALAVVLLAYGLYLLWPAGSAPEVEQGPAAETAPADGGSTIEPGPVGPDGMIRRELEIDPKPLPSGPAAPEAPAAAPSAAAPAPEEQYAFYHLLRDYEVLIPEQDLPPPPKKLAASVAPAAAEKTAPAPPDKTASTQASGTYLLQVGSFRTSAQADRLKARLAGLGFEAGVHSARVNEGETWYRVRIGPYRNRDELAAYRRRLEESGFKPIAVKLTR